jgi:hypothetical protein
LTVTGKRGSALQDETWTEREDELLKRVAEKLKNDPQFTADEVAALRIIIDAYRGWRVFGRGAKWIVYILAGVAGGITAWNTILLEARKWFS